MRTDVLLDPLAKLGSKVQGFCLLPYFMVFCSGASFAYLRTRALSCSITQVYLQWVEFLLLLTIIYYNINV